jgi:hypothetical protein
MYAVVVADDAPHTARSDIGDSQFVGVCPLARRCALITTIGRNSHHTSPR